MLSNVYDDYIFGQVLFYHSSTKVRDAKVCNMWRVVESPNVETPQKLVTRRLERDGNATSMWHRPRDLHRVNVRAPGRRVATMRTTEYTA